MDSYKPLYYLGQKVVLTDGGFWQAVRRHSRRANQRKESYHNRIQKKWGKRFGQDWVTTLEIGRVIAMGGVLVIRNEDWAKVMASGALGE